MKSFNHFISEKKRIGIAAPAPEPVSVETAPVTPTTEASPETGSKAEDILAMIRARQQKS